MKQSPDSNNDFEFLYSLSKALSSTLDQTQLLDMIIEAAKTLTMAEASSLLLLDENTQRLHFAHATGQVSEELKKLSLPIGQGIAGWVAREKKPQIVNQADKDNRWYKGIDEKTKFITRSLLCVPLVLDDKTVGVIEVLNKLESQSFDERDQELLLKVAEMAARVLENADKYHKLQTENLQLRDDIASRYTIIGESPSIREVLGLAQKVALSNTTVLLQGENGTGKELLARYIHNQSPRRDKAFIAVNCAAIPLELLESELFGHEKGSFTGAINLRRGRFELAHQGTIFLDEVGDLPLAVQAKILRVLQEREFERLGGSETIKVDVRIVGATNHDLIQLVRENQFREDLYYRLNVFQIFLPPLRQRREDIPVLAEHFLKYFCRETKKNIMGFSAAVINSMLEYSWPGNIRELQNVIERAVVISSGKVINNIMLQDISVGGKKEMTLPSNIPWDEAQKIFKKEYLIKILNANNWNQRKAASAIKIQPTYLSRLIKELNITKP
ncbi:MAG: sigma 54-interacting transcriptional regulator [Candidatus Edwardsbacteria bacterium]|nr:sigma 54-interacting transcriptional regulator [Candidatus Edwardsbacteria bacterium]